MNSINSAHTATPQPARFALRSRSVFACSLLIFGALCAACGGDDPEDDTGTDVDTDASDVVEDPIDDAADVEDTDTATDPPDVQDADADQDVDVDDGGDVSDVGDVELGDTFDVDIDADPTFGEGIFERGCPLPGGALARELIGDEALPGDVAVGGAGDFVLANEHAAFVITRPDAGSTYYHYGGILADAAAVDGCEVVGVDEFEELGLILGQLNLGDFTSSRLRAFRGTSSELINDGSDGGPAIVRMSGDDAPYWLVEYTLVIQRFTSGADYLPLSEPFGPRYEVDYILNPGSNVLEVKVRVINMSDERVRLITGAIMTFDESHTQDFFAKGALNIGGFNLQTEIPWMVSTDLTGAYAFGIPGASMAFAGIAGVNALVDVAQATAAPISVGPAGSADDTEEISMLFAVGARDSNSATMGMLARNPNALGGRPLESFELNGTVEDSDGVVIEDAWVAVEVENSAGDWFLAERLDAADGSFQASLADLRGEMRLVAHVPGRDPAAPVSLTIDAATDVALSMGAHGRLLHRIVDGDGLPSPAKLTVRRSDGWNTFFYVVGEGEVDLPPGEYSVAVTRGYEYEALMESVEIVADGDATVDVILEHVVDTTGYLSVDTHIHAAPSPDSTVGEPLRLRGAAGNGLEVAVATEHEIVADISWALPESGVEAFLGTSTGLELTAVIPEHMTALPLVPDGTPRGGPVPWYQMDVDQIYAAGYDRGAEIMILNHPKNGGNSCNYMCLIGWDPVTSTATLDDPTLLGLDSGAALWSWNFDGIEYQNGHRNVFRNPANLDTGFFDDWQGFLNHGHRITAIGASDAHGVEGVGYPRSYFRSSTDDPAAFLEADLVSAIDEGRVVVSSGAFARVAVDGVDAIGETLDASSGTVDLAVRIEAMAGIDVTRVVVFANCDEVAEFAATDPNGVVKYDDIVTLTLTEDSHVTVLAFGENRYPDGLPQFNPTSVPRVTTNAVYFDVDGNGEFDAPGDRECVYDEVRP